MVADAVESASRTLSDPAPARLEGLVSELIDKRLRDGQFDECGLTLREIAEIRDSLIKSLIGIYHGASSIPSIERLETSQSRFEISDTQAHLKIDRAAHVGSPAVLIGENRAVRRSRSPWSMTRRSIGSTVRTSATTGRPT